MQQQPQHDGSSSGMPPSSSMDQSLPTRHPHQFLPRHQPPGLSPEEDPSFGEAAAASPWHRMKWTDSMVRLLIMVVYCMGDDAATTAESDHHQQPQPQPQPQPAAALKGKKSASILSSQQQQQQKKGKWKSVSKAMLEKGFCVSPQQCEDKFNDLNKRYKRVNEILGKGTACRVVENQALLDTMHHLPPKAKEEARKLINSKHLFFREMCAYHNGTASSCTAAAAAAVAPSLQPQEDDPDGSNDVVSDSDAGDYDDEDDSHSSMKRPAVTSAAASPPLSLSLWSPPAAPSVKQRLESEMMGVAGRGGRELREWVKRKAEELEEQRVGYMGHALRLARQRLKWVRFSSNKEREMERMRLENERMKLENERMLLLLRKKEMELVNYNNNNGGGGGGGNGSSLSVQLNGERFQTMTGGAAAGPFDV